MDLSGYHEAAEPQRRTNPPGKFIAQQNTSVSYQHLIPIYPLLLCSIVGS